MRGKCVAEWVSYRFDCVFESPFGEAACPRGCMKDEVVKTSVLLVVLHTRLHHPLCLFIVSSRSYRHSNLTT